ncbi:hypothetical protein H0W80_00810 [Candidatus Saccharibacteria bacterium]|nr:hypothetical protein [Candidatus Saccharibacteria bacterium]
MKKDTEEMYFVGRLHSLIQIQSYCLKISRIANLIWITTLFLNMMFRTELLRTGIFFSLGMWITCLLIRANIEKHANNYRKKLGWSNEFLLQQSELTDD